MESQTDYLERNHLTSLLCKDPEPIFQQAAYLYCRGNTCCLCNAQTLN